jgi:citrate synthase
MQNDSWQSALTATSCDAISVRGYDLTEMIGRVSFPSVLYLLYVGELPTNDQALLIDALMVAAIDHGPVTPSALAARVAVSGGATMQAAAAAGLLSMGKFHGTVVEDSRIAIDRVLMLAKHENQGIAAAAERVVADLLASGQRISGFGHRQHKTRDPRIDRLFELSRELGKSTEHRQAATAIEDALRSSTGHDLPINVDGAMAVILGDLGFPLGLSNALFMAARLAGVLRHAAEEQTMLPMRRINPSRSTYSGPSPRPLPEEYKK